jgi:predicted lipid-binding transport protein (Tim44 family)
MKDLSAGWDLARRIGGIIRASKAAVAAVLLAAALFWAMRPERASVPQEEAKFCQAARGESPAAMGRTSNGAACLPAHAAVDDSKSGRDPGALKKAASKVEIRKAAGEDSESGIVPAGL